MRCFCLNGSGATHPGPGEQCHLSLFDTNDDLLEVMKQTSAAHEIAAVFHVAALCDYKVKQVEDDQGRSCNSPKIASRSGARRQIEENRTDAWVLNGKAYGSGFGFCRAHHPVLECKNKTDLVQSLTEWLPARSC